VIADAKHCVEERDVVEERQALDHPDRRGPGAHAIFRIFLYV
jgi:hypothetical protein